MTFLILVLLKISVALFHSLSRDFLDFGWVFDIGDFFKITTSTLFHDYDFEVHNGAF